jgi:hypothetical protein
MVSSLLPPDVSKCHVCVDGCLKLSEVYELCAKGATCISVQFSTTFAIEVSHEYTLPLMILEFLHILQF